MSKTKYISIFIIVVLFVLGTVGTAIAGVPVLPSSFYGEININDNSPSVGDTVYAYVTGVTAAVAQATIQSESSALVYSLNVPGDDPDTTSTKEGGVAGDTVTFKIGSRIVAKGTWSEGTNVNLVFHPPQALPGGPYSGEVDSSISFNGSANDSGGDAETYEWDWDNDGTYDASGASASHSWSSIGSKTVGFKVTDAQGGEGTATVSVEVTAYAADITLDAGSLTQTYDGSPKSVTATTVPSGLSYSVTYDGGSTAPTDAGSYPVVATITETGYTGSSDSGTLTIEKAGSTTTVTGGIFTYDGSAHAATVTVTGVGGLSLTPEPTYSCGSAPIDVDDTPCTASYTYAGDANHTGSSDSDTITITPASATINISGLSHTYDGSPKSATVTTNPAGLSYSITYAGGTTVPSNAGSYAVVATITNSNYDSASDSGTLVIAKASSTTTVTGGTFIYDGSAHAATVSVTGAGGLDLSPTPTYSCGSAPINVADTPCTASYTYAGDENHTGSSDSDTITITPALATVILSDLSQVYDGTAKEVTVTTDPTGLSYSVTYDGEEEAPSAPGSYDVEVTITDPNYSGSGSGTLVIMAVHSLSLVQGWNLVSFVVNPEDTDIAIVLDSVEGNFDLVYAWDASGAHSGSGNWLKYDNVELTTDTLTDLDATTGFWIHMTTADTLDVVGALPEVTGIPIMTAADGWNLVGYPSDDNGALPGILSALGTDFSLVYAYNASDVSDPWKLYDRTGADYANDLSELLPGWGYWIKASAAHTWSVTY